MRTRKHAIGCAYRRWAATVASDNGTVIHDADRSLAAWLASMLPDSMTITFEPPGPSWPQQSPPRPFVDAFLYDIREAENGLTADLSPVRAPNGDLIGRRPSVRRYRLSFALTAWTAEATAGHELLGSIMAGCAASEVIPPGCLHGALAEAGLPVPARCAPAEARWCRRRAAAGAPALGARWRASRAARSAPTRRILPRSSTIT